MAFAGEIDEFLGVFDRFSGIPFAPGNDVTADVVIGRTLACCLHPAAAWRRVSKSGKALIIGAYFVVGYLGVLAALLTR